MGHFWLGSHPAGGGFSGSFAASWSARAAMAKKYRSVWFLNSKPGGVGGGEGKDGGEEDIAARFGGIDKADTLLEVTGSDGVVGVRMIPGIPYYSM